jgi:hypothetical protein
MSLWRKVDHKSRLLSIQWINRVLIKNIRKVMLYLETLKLFNLTLMIQQWVNLCNKHYTLITSKSIPLITISHSQKKSKSLTNTMKMRSSWVKTLFVRLTIPFKWRTLQELRSKSWRIMLCFSMKADKFPKSLKGYQYNIRKMGCLSWY